MKINSEAIYETRAIEPYKEGKVCLTQKKDGTLYLIYLADEDERKMPETIHLSTLCPDKGAKITIPGTTKELKWKKAGEGFDIIIPKNLQNNPPCDYAWVFKVQNK